MLRDTRPLLFAALLAGFLWLSWLVISPFLSGLVWAAAWNSRGGLSSREQRQKSRENPRDRSAAFA